MAPNDSAPHSSVVQYRGNERSRGHCARLEPRMPPGLQVQCKCMCRCMCKSGVPRAWEKGQENSFRFKHISCGVK
eukprot:11566512-Alexandrium_andersonii.AAC.1